MKRAIVVFLIFILSAMLFAGCVSGNADVAGTGKDDAEETAPSFTEAADEVRVTSLCVGTAMPGDEYEKAEWSGRLNENGRLKVLSGGEVVIPYEHFVSSETNIETGKRYTDGVPLSFMLPEITGELPVIDRLASFSMMIMTDWGNITDICVYDSDFDLIASVKNEQELRGIIGKNEGELIVDVQIEVSGCEIFEVGWQSTVMGYAFKVRAAEGTEENAYPRSGYLFVISDGKNAVPYEYFMYGTSVYYEEGKPAGMVNADGMALFSQLPELLEGNKLPEIEREKGCLLSPIPIAQIIQINVYDADFNRVAFNITEEEFYDVVDIYEGTLIPEVYVRVNGPYYEELGEGEYNVRGYAFIL